MYLCIFWQSEIYVYTLDNDTLVKKTSSSLSHVTAICDLAYSPDGAYLASADDNRRVNVFRTTDYGVFHAE